MPTADKEIFNVFSPPKTRKEALFVLPDLHRTLIDLLNWPTSEVGDKFSENSLCVEVVCRERRASEE